MPKPADDITLAITWFGLPPYAAHCIAEFSRRFEGTLIVLGTEGPAPRADIEAIIAQPVIWLDADKAYSWVQMGLAIPDVYLQSGWAYPVFNSLGHAVQKNGGVRYGMLDNFWLGTLRQIIGLAYFRLFYRRWFNAVLVPGRAGRRFCKLLGVPNNRVFEGMYGASPRTFYPGKPLSERPKRMIFVGQLIGRKNVLVLLEAIERSTALQRGWEFVFIGSGVLEEQVKGSDNVRLIPYSSPEAISEWMRESQFLLLFSVFDNWGLVAHEAAACGCGLGLSGAVAAGQDLVGRYNGVVVDDPTVQHVADGIDRLSSYTQSEKEKAYRESVAKAEEFGPHRFADALFSMLRSTVPYPGKIRSTVRKEVLKADYTPTRPQSEILTEAR